MTDTQLEIPLTDEEAWQVGQVLQYPYSTTGSSTLAPVAGDEARVSGFAFADRYEPTSITSDSAKQPPSFQLTIPATLVALTPPNSPHISSVTGSGGSVSSGGSTVDSALTVKVGLSGTGVVAGQKAKLYNGATVSSGLSLSATIATSNVSSGFINVATSGIVAGGYTITARLLGSGGAAGPVSDNTWPVTVTT